MKTYLYNLCKRYPSASSNKRSRLIDGSSSDLKKRDRGEVSSSFQEVLCLEDNADMETEIIFHLLKCRRESRFIKLITNFEGELDDTESFQTYLPAIYKPFAADIDRLKEQLCSLYEITNRYHILRIELTSPCYGCRNELPSQYDHMECNTGCLHDPMFCANCPVTVPSPDPHVSCWTD